MTKLLVPIHVEALVKGPGQAPLEAVQRAPDFSGVAFNEFRGEQLERTLFTSSDALYEGSGVHLHWALPDGLRHGVAKSEREAPAFPAIPNRWLVVRSWDEGAPSDALRLSQQAWIVESDAMDAEGDGIEWPVPELDYKARVGKCYALSAWPGERSSQRRVKLTALGYGDPTFSAYYPACRTNLGFHDDALDALPDGTRLSYLVLGWYADSKGDPFADATRESLTDLLKHYQWTLSDQVDLANASLPRGILCHGVISGIAWQQQVESGVPDEDEASKLEITLGETAVEALGQLETLHTTLDPQGRLTRDDSLADLLAAFQYDLLDDLARPGGDALLAHKLHLRKFRPSVRGRQWELMPPAAAAKVLGTAPSAERMPAVPGEVEARLRALNDQERACNRLRRERDGWKRELYAAWYQGERAGGEAHERAALWAKYESEIARLTARIDAFEALTTEHGRAKLCSGLEEKLALLLPGWTLSAADEPAFYRPNDPVLLLSGAAIPSSDRHGQDGCFRKDGRLLCRLTGQELTGIRAQLPGYVADTQLDAAKLDAWSGLKLGAHAGSIPAEASALFRESLLLTLASPHAAARDAALDPSIDKRAKEIVRGVGAAADQVALGCEQLLEGYFAGIWYDASRLEQEAEPVLRRTVQNASAPSTWELVGTLPSPIANYRWRKNPWQPLFLQWQVLWTPTYADTPDALDNWSLSQRGDGFTHASAGAADAVGQWYAGSTLLSPGATAQLSERLRQYDIHHPSKELKELRATLRNLSTLSQSLAGFSEQLLLRKRHVELNPLDSGDEAPTLSPIAAQVRDVDWLSPMVEGRLLPVRAGHLQVEQLWLVDAFGQYLALNPAQLRAVNRVLEPRLAQAARLTVDWSERPICGWIVPNFLDQGLMIYDAEGVALGALQVVMRGSEAVGGNGDPIESFHWIDIPGSRHVFLGSDPSRLDPLLPDADPQLRTFVRWLLTRSEGEGQRFHRLLAQLVQSDLLANASERRDAATLGLLVGRPLALARACIALELDGLDMGAIADLTLPVQLGQHRAAQPKQDDLRSILDDLRDDGLVGYMQDSQFALASEATAPLQLSTTQPLEVTLLMDPDRGVPVTSGVLPRIVFRLPAGHGVERLEGSSLLFFAGPILSPAHETKLSIPEPSDLYGQWSWHHHPSLQAWGTAEIADTTKEQAQALTTQLSEGWLKLVAEPLTLRQFGVYGESPKNADQDPATPRQFSAKRGDSVTLAWSVVGAERIELRQGATLLFASAQHPLPSRYRLSVENDARLVLMACARDGTTATLSLALDVSAP
jgi:hypothetical protein